MSDISLFDFFRDVYAPLRLLGGSDKTRRRWRTVLGQFQLFLGRQPLVSDLDEETVCRFLDLYSEGRSQRTVYTARAHLVAVWNLAARKRLVPEFPAVSQVKLLHKIPNAWTVEQIERILDVTMIQTGKIDGVPARFWWSGLILVLFDTGVRVGAMLQVPLADLNLDAGQLLVKAEYQKQRADQLFTLHRQTLQIIRAGLVEDRKLLFPWPLHPTTIYNRYNKILERAGLPHGREDKFHRLRRSSATLCELTMGPGSATAHLGHSSPRITEAYLDRRQLPVPDVANHLPRPELNLDGNGEEKPRRNWIAELGEPAPTPEPQQSDTSGDRPQFDLPELPLPERRTKRADPKALARCVEAFEKAIASRSQKYQEYLRGALRQFLDGCEIEAPEDLRQDRVLQFFGGLRLGNSTKTLELYTTCVRTFLKALPPEMKRLDGVRQCFAVMRVKVQDD